MTPEQILEKWLFDLKQDLIKNYDALGLRASGNWAASLEEFTRQEPGVLKGGILGQRYTGAIENGRKKNTDQSKEGIEAWVGWAGSTFLDQWVKDKKLEDIINPYAAAWKIALSGWMVPNRYNEGELVESVATPERFAELSKELGALYAGQIRSEIVKSLGNGDK